MIVHFLLILILCGLNLIPVSLSFRKKYILPFSFLCIGLFMGLRYDYGLDYWNYYEAFTNTNNDISKEFGFWSFFYSFEKYYVYNLVKSLLLSFIMYYFVKKYVPERYYAFFIFVFMLHKSLIYTMITAERSCLGSMVLMICLEFCYFRKKRLLLLSGLIIISALLFHNTLLTMLIIPVMDVVINREKKVRIEIIMTIAIIIGIISPFIIEPFFEYLTTHIDLFNNYGYYIGTNRFKGSNLFGVVNKLLLLFPMYYLLSDFNRQEKNSIYTKLLVLSLVYLFIYFMELESDGRYGMLLIPFMLICICQRIKTLKNKGYSVIMLLPFLINTLLGTISIYTRMIDEPWLPGNYMSYKTIFDVGFFK